MNVDLPSGCNYFSAPNQFTNYSGGVASTYIINEGKAIKTRVSDYYSIPTGYQCIQNGSIKYMPEFPVYAEFMSIILCVLIAGLLWKTLGRVLGR